MPGLATETDNPTFKSISCSRGNEEVSRVWSSISERLIQNAQQYFYDDWLFMASSVVIQKRYNHLLFQTSSDKKL